MMRLEKADLKALAETSGFPRVSLYLPTHRVAAHTEQDRIRLKNLLQQAEQSLLAGGLRTTAVKELLAPAYRLYHDNLFWQQQRDGLAVFLAPEFSRHFRLPLAFNELVVVSEYFHLKPLLLRLTGECRFYVLAVSKDHIRLLEGTRDDITEVDAAGVPVNLAAALKYDDPQNQLQFQSLTPDSGGHRAAIFHGQSQSEDEKDRLLLYFQKIDRGLRELFRDEQVPLVLAGVDYFLPIYREANSYPYLVEVAIAGAADELSNEELHRLAWAALQPRFQQSLELATARYQQFAGTGLTSRDLCEVISAAHEGRVETLFAALGRPCWGHFDPKTAKVTTHEQQEPGDRDLLDFAAVEAMMNGATVYAVDPGAVPEGVLAAAVFRY